jgi:hypothetical protein
LPEGYKMKAIPPGIRLGGKSRPEVHRAPGCRLHATLGWGSPEVIGTLIAGLAGLAVIALFVRWERLTGPFGQACRRAGVQAC